MMQLKIIFKKSLLCILIAMSLVLPSLASAQSSLPIPGANNYGENIIAPPSTVNGQKVSGIDQAKLLVEGLLLNFKWIIGIIGVGIIIVLAIMMIMAQGKEEEIKQHTKGIIFVIVALGLVGLASDLAEILSPEGGGIIRDTTETLRRVQLFDYKVNIVITFIKYLIGTIAVLFLIRIGLRMVTVSNSEENATQDKKNLGMIAGAFLLLYLGEIAINQVFYRIDKTKVPGVDGIQPSIDVKAGISEIVGFTNFVVLLTAPIAVAVLVAGAIMYITAAGEEERTGKAKRMIISAVIGMVIIYGAFAIVSTFMPGQVTVEATGNPTTNPAT